MKICVTSSGASLESPFDNRFGRAPYFIIYNSDDKSFSAIDNSVNINASQGAGIQAAQLIADSGAKVLLTSNLGPKAGELIYASGIKVYQVETDSVQKAIDLYLKGELKELKESNVEGHA
jgi:predicted Fe-Mo cluster-binding NifX family protein